MNMTEALHDAVAAHAKWKYQLREAIDTGKSPWHIGDVRTDRACEFGKWLLALPQPQRLSGHWEKVRALHAEFHTAAADVLELALAGRKDEAIAAMGFSSRFMAVSWNLIKAISAWQESESESSPK